MRVFKSLFWSGSFLKTLFVLCYFISLIAKVLDLVHITSLVNAVFAIMAVYATFKGKLISKPVIFELILILLLLLFYNIIGFSQLYSGWEGANERGVFLQTFLLFVYLTIPCYLSKKGKLIDEDIIIMFLVTFVYAIVMYFKNLLTISLISVTSFGVGDITNNIGYMFVCLSPFIYLLKDKKKQILLLLISAIFVILSAKRGAILLEFLFLFYYLYNSYLKGRITLGRILMVLALLGVVTIIGYKIMLSNDYIYDKFIRTTEGYSSGRDTLAEDILGYVFGSSNSSLGLFFGNGIGTSVYVAGNWAHNDWLELLSMSGILGVLIYLKLYISMYGVVRRSNMDVFHKIFSSATMMLFVMTFFSMAFFISTGNSYSLMILVGYSYGKIMSQRKRIQTNLY